MESKKRGRPSGKLLNKYSFDLDKISNYFKENKKEEQPQPQEQPQTQQRVIVFDKNMLIKADIVFSAIMESGLDLIGVKKEILPVSEKEADLLIEIMPPITLERNWTNFFIAYILLKITQ